MTLAISDVKPRSHLSNLLASSRFVNFSSHYSSCTIISRQEIVGMLRVVGIEIKSHRKHVKHVKWPERYDR